MTKRMMQLGFYLLAITLGFVLGVIAMHHLILYDQETAQAARQEVIDTHHACAAALGMAAAQCTRLLEEAKEAECDCSAVSIKYLDKQI